MSSDRRLLNALKNTAQGFARRRMKGAYRGEQSAFYLGLCSDKVAVVTPTVLVETEDRIEIFTRVEASNWSLAIVCKKAKLRGSRAWSTLPADVLSIDGVDLDNIEAVAGWLNAY